MPFSHNKYGKRIIFFFSDKKEELPYTITTEQKSDRPPWLLTLCNQTFRLRRNQSSLRAVSSSLLPHSLCSVRLQADVFPFLPGNSPLTLTETLLFLQKDIHQPIARRGKSREKGCCFLYDSSRFILFPRTQVKTNAGSARLSLLPEHVVSSHRHMSQPFHRLEGAGSAQGRGSHLQARKKGQRADLHPRIAAPDLQKEVSSRSCSSDSIRDMLTGSTRSPARIPACLLCCTGSVCRWLKLTAQGF